MLVSIKKLENLLISSRASLILEMNGFIHEHVSVANSLRVESSDLRFRSFSSSFMKDKLRRDNGSSLETISLAISGGKSLRSLSTIPC